MPTPVTEHGLRRVVNFSDGVVAIALTLLVLPLTDIAPQIQEHGGVGPLLTQNWSSFLAFGISFLVIALFWVIHHQVFEAVIAYNRWVVWINLCWLASIVFMPFATNMLSYAPDHERGVYALYIGTLLASSAMMLLLEVALRRSPDLLRPGAAEQLDISRMVVVTALFGLALVLAVAVPRVGMLWLLLMILGRPVARIIRGRSPREPQA